MDFNARITALTGALDRSPSEALALAEALKTELLDAPLTDPVKLGWARDYRIRSLYFLGRDREGLSLLTNPPPRLMTIKSGNAAWLHSVGAEMAVRAGAPELCRGLMRKALDLRIVAKDRDGARVAVEMGALLLQRAGLWAEVDAWVDEVEARTFRAPPGSDEAVFLSEALARLTSAAWFPGALPTAAQRRAEMALHAAARSGNVAEVKRLLAEGVSPNARHPSYAGLPTPLLAASFMGHAPVVRLLLDADADLAGRSIQGRTALHHAADQNHSRIVALLCDAGAPRDIEDYRGHTALQLASWQGHVESVDALVRGLKLRSSA